MWTYEYAAEADVAPDRIWAVLADIDGWTAWDTSMEAIAIHGPFAVGTEISMTPAGQDPIRSTIVAVVPNERYADETQFGGVTLHFSHTLHGLPGSRTRIVHRLDITGPGATELAPELGPAITEDFPEAMAGLIAQAGRTRAPAR